MSRGYKKLKEAVLNDIQKYDGIFNPNGCNQCGAKCFNEYCDKFKWIIDRVKNYAEKTGIPWEELLDKWEDNRDYWYMNYYQEAYYPELNEEVKVFKTIEDLKKSVGNLGFRCPYCNGISSKGTKCDSGLMVKLINKKGKHPCNWSAGGLFRTLGKGAVIFIKEIGIPVEIFTPIAWEKEDN